ncbi:MAG: VWA domain-containing protein [Desulfobacterales bacterium]|nr:VWA domain-containing protein [Desulfobacterales bacterium]
MTFSDLSSLWLVWTVPVLFLVCFWGLGRRARILMNFSAKRGLSVISPDAPASRRWVKAGLLLAVVMLLVISLAGPQYGYRWREIEQKGVDLIVAIDCSKSMLAKDIQPTRLDRAKREVVDLLNLLQGDRVGLVAFSGTAFLQCPLTLDYEAFHLFLGALTPTFLPVGGTDLAAAVRTAISGFNAGNTSDKAVILITDGESTGEEAPLDAARAAAAAKIRLFCVGVGATDGVPIPAADGGFVKDGTGNIVLTRLDEDTLKKMAVMTGGSYVRSVAGDMDLETIYAKHIRKEMTSATLNRQKKKILENRFQWFLALAVFLMGVEMMIPPRKKATAVMAVALLLFANGSIAGAATPQDLIREGQRAYEAGDYETALTRFVDAQLEAPDLAEIHYNIGNAQYKAGDYQAALNSYKQALLSTDQTMRRNAHYNMGNALFRLGQHKEALASYRAALKIDAKDQETIDNIAFVKKVMEQPKPPQQQGDKSQDDSLREDTSQKNKDEKKSSSENREDPSNQTQSAANTEKNPSGEKKNQPDSSPVNQPQNKPDTDADKQVRSGQKEMDEQARQQAERMLNRLEDMPGRALMPAYRERHVEKDW